MPKPQPSLVQQEIAVRTERDAPEPIYRTGVDLVDCVLGCGDKTRNATRECDQCVREHNECELRRGGWESSYGIEREGWT